MVSAFPVAHSAPALSCWSDTGGLKPDIFSSLSAPCQPAPFTALRSCMCACGGAVVVFFCRLCVGQLQVERRPHAPLPHLIQPREESCTEPQRKEQSSDNQASNFVSRLFGLGCSLNKSHSINLSLQAEPDFLLLSTSPARQLFFFFLHFLFQTSPVSEHV